MALAAAAMGTRFELVLAPDRSAPPERQPGPADLRALGEDALAEILRLDALWSRFRPDSDLSRLARAEPGVWVSVASETFAAVELCLALCADSGGRFDPGVGALLGIHGFRGPGEAAQGAGGLARELLVAGATRIEEGLALACGRGQLMRDHPRFELDFGAIGKGLALDAVAELWADEDEWAFVAFAHGGTSTGRLFGAAEPQRIGLADPAASSEPSSSLAASSPASFSLRSGAYSVSAPGGRRNAAGQGHVLDPRDGQPTRGASLAVAWHPSAAVADAWSTAGLVPGALAELLGRPIRGLGLAVRETDGALQGGGSLPEGW